MDNNPFRNNQPNNNGNTGYMTPTMGGQPQQQQQQQQPYGAGGYSSAAYPQQQPQQPWQSNTTTPNTPYSPLQAQNTSFTSLPQQNTYSSPTPPPFNSSNNQPQQQYSSPYNNTSSLMSSAPSIGGSSGVLGGGGGNTYQPYQGSTTMPTPNVYNGNVGGGYNAGYGGIQTQPQQQQSPYGSNNFYIPANFGQSTTPSNTNTNMFQPQQPRHAPVDASSLLQGTQVKRVECPVCQKTIEGDDMAVNHHVNEHYS